MHCIQCGFTNPTEMKFCGQCGQSLDKVCEQCGFNNPLTFRFCGQCGASLAGSSTVPAPLQQAVSSSQKPKAERRQLTVMFCDMVGSTALSTQLDPEELREIIQQYQETVTQVVTQFDGYIAQYLGDGLLIYFGYPTAHENDARRAALAGLGILQALKQGNTLPTAGNNGDNQLKVRVGIHTGLVVVGQVGSGENREQLALGETTNIAARVQGLAQPNTLYISPSTYRLVQGFFKCQSQGHHILKGVSQSIELYRVLGQSQAHTQLDAALASSTYLTPLVGRKPEVEALLSQWEQVKQGQTSVILLSGEAGLGKSRLVQVLKEQLSNEPHIWLSCYTLPYYQNRALYPIIEMLQRRLNFKSTDTPTQKLEKLEQVLDQYGLPLPETVPLFTALFGLVLPQNYQPLNLTPQRQKQKAVEALITILSNLANVQPVVAVFEDLHWADPSTLDMLNILVKQVPNKRIFGVFTFRPQFESPWSEQTNVAHLTLTRLTRPQVETIVKQLAGGKLLPAELLEHIVTKTDGNPIFVEELTKMVLDLELLQAHNNHYQLRGPLPNLAIPTTLQDSLMARLDRLATGREVAQLGAMLGRKFSYTLLQAISPLDELSLQNDLDRLVDAEILYQTEELAQITYTFKHALIQEAAYRSLLRRKRQQYHQHIAEVLTKDFPNVAQTEPELLAHHYTAAGSIQLALSYWQKAGQQAVGQSANVEAMRYFQKALDLLETLPASLNRTRQELHLKVALGVPLLMVKGYASPDIEANYAQARELCRLLGQTPQLAPVIYGLWVFYLVRANYQTALELGQQLMSLAEQSPQNKTLRLEADQVYGTTYFYLGNLLKAKDHLEQAIKLYNPQTHGTEVSLHSGADKGVACLCHLTLTLWLLGYPDQALNRGEEALALAEELAHPYSIAFALSFLAWLHQYRGEAALTLNRANAAIALSHKQGFALLAAFSTILAGWAMTEQEQIEAGINQIFKGLADFKTTGAELGQLHFLALSAQAHNKADQIEEGLAVLAGALIVVKEKGERFYEAELYRLKGELLLQQLVLNPLSAAPQNDILLEVEACFKQAIERANKQQAKSLHLRAAMSLSRLYQLQDQAEQARQILETSYNAMSEGWDTVDLQEANSMSSNLKIL